MKYLYAYKTGDGIRHEDAMEASCREDVFAELRKRGIKAIKVVASDGSKANGEIRGIRKRVVAFSLIAVALGAVAFTSLYYSFKPSEIIVPEIVSQERRQLIGDVALIEKGIHTGWSDVFEDEGDRFLASFAIPGVKAGQRNTTVGEIEASLGRAIPLLPTDGIEARQIKAMVEGMKQEARDYIAAGGTIAGYGKRLTARQDAEIALYERTKAEIETAKKSMPTEAFMSEWERRNAELRNLGIKLVPLPD